jgi:hypothetical protein
MMIQARRLLPQLAAQHDLMAVRAAVLGWNELVEPEPIDVILFLKNIQITIMLC